MPFVYFVVKKRLDITSIICYISAIIEIQRVNSAADMIFLKQYALNKMKPIMLIKENNMSNLQTFAVKSLLSLLARKTEQMRTNKHHPNRKKCFIFTEKSLPDFSIRYITTRLYGNRVFCIFCIFLQIYRKSKRSLLSTKMNKNNQTLRIRNAVLHFPISGPKFFAEHCIKNTKKPFTTQKALE